MVPSQSDIAKRKLNRDKLAKKITEDGHLKENELIRIVRKAIDSAWMTAANKLVFLEDRVIHDMNPATRTKWLVECNQCGKMFKLADVQIDHRIGEFACTNREDFYAYILSRLDVGFDDLQVLCIPDHEIKTLGERLGITFEEARIEKAVIAIMKEKASVIDKWLGGRGIKVAKNPQARRDAVRQCLIEEKMKDE